MIKSLFLFKTYKKIFIVILAELCVLESFEKQVLEFYTKLWF